jgi:ribonuclease H / adenosylcobalamin/alpha-ribazole phosphatase
VTRLVVEADGGSRGNPGPAGYGALVRDPATGEVLLERCDSLGTTTNNVAEYSGLVAGLRAAADLAPGADVEVRMDSKLVVEQMSGRWKIKDPNLGSLARSAQGEARRLGRVSYVWVPRARNADADRLANQAMDAAAGIAAPAAPAVPAVPAAAVGSTAQPSATTFGRGPGWRAPDDRATTTLLLRHGETPLSIERRFAGRGDIPLTEEGLRQAGAAAGRLAARGGVDAIVASPLRRTLQTAEVVAEATGVPVLADDGLVELDFGKWEGLTIAEASKRWPDEVTAWLGDVNAAPPGGESFASAITRVNAALDRLLAEHQFRTLLLVSHVSPIKIAVCRALLAPPATLFRFQLDVASLCQIDWYADGPATVRSVNDIAHLSRAGR